MTSIPVKIRNTNKEVVEYAKSVVVDIVNDYNSEEIAMFNDDRFRSAFEFILSRDMPFHKVRLYICYLHILHFLMYGIRRDHSVVEDIESIWNIYRRSFDIDNLIEIENFINTPLYMYSLFWLFPKKALQYNNVRELARFVNHELSRVLRCNYAFL